MLRAWARSDASMARRMGQLPLGDQHLERRLKDAEVIGSLQRPRRRSSYSPTPMLRWPYSYL
jgi:hypothetical protein